LGGRCDDVMAVTAKSGPKATKRQTQLEWVM